MSTSRARLMERYRSLHEGLGADSVESISYSPPPDARPEGRVSDIYYTKQTTQGSELFRHDYQSGSRQGIAVDPRGHLVFMGGKSVVTTRGIEDLPAGLRGKDHRPSAPKVLTALGVLERIEYEDQTGKKRAASFGKPVLAHDERGDLHALYVSGSDHGSSSKGRRRTMARRNPVEGRLDLKESAMLMVQTAFVVGGMSVISARTMNWALDSWVPTLGRDARSGIKIGGGLLGGLLISMLASKVGTLKMQIFVAQLASGWAVGGFAAGLSELYDAYVAPMMMPAPAQQQAPAQRAYLGASQAAVPSGYSVTNPAACGVGR